MGPSLTPEEVLEEIKARRLLEHPRVVDPYVEGELDLENRKATVRVAFQSTLRLPKFWLEPPDALGVLPHLDAEICYQEKEGLVLDRRDPGGILKYAIQKARRVLLDGLSSSNREGFATEFASIWNRRADAETTFSVLTVGGEPRRIAVLSAPDSPIYVADSEDVIRDFFGGSGLRTDRNLRRGIYVPLGCEVSVVPPAPRGPMWSAREIRKVVLDGVQEEHRDHLRRLLKKKPGRIEYCFFSLPTGHGGHSLFGVRFTVSGETHPLEEGGEIEKITPLHLKRYDRAFLVPRGGGVELLSEKQALVIGCGAVGGAVAQSLSRIGIGSIHFTDFDKLTEENTFRHILGREYWNQNKAEAIAQDLQKNIPYLHTEAFPERIEELVDRQDFTLASYDLVVVALGNPTVEMYINDITTQLGAEAPLTVYAWVEPLGLGGHALLTGTEGGGGCFECVFTSLHDPSEDRVRDRLAFAAPDQEFGRELAGCGSLHTPYGFIDAARTANLAVALGISALRGAERYNVAESWKGDSAIFESQGFNISSRWALSDDEIKKHRRWRSNPRCPVCGLSGA